MGESELNTPFFFFTLQGVRAPNTQVVQGSPVCSLYLLRQEKKVKNTLKKTVQQYPLNYKKIPKIIKIVEVIGPGIEVLPGQVGLTQGLHGCLRIDVPIRV